MPMPARGPGARASTALTILQAKSSVTDSVSSAAGGVEPLRNSWLVILLASLSVTSLTHWPHVRTDQKWFA